ncbi:MAG: DivIVA domain-containing protein [Erysipelothrix sp.]|jgi:DivIVA domain-containing protein|nr:DivIVA domain-containing protein [Erysipelothrix sp.]
MNNKLKHSPTTIINKAFHVDFKGYSPFEVDLFLDEIMQDYRLMATIQKQYEDEIALLKANNLKFQERLIQLESQLATLKDTPSNSDLLKRLARLESLIDQKD